MLVALLTAALFLRVVALNTVPPGMTHDEAAFGAEAEQILAGERPIYFALGYGHEPLYAYAVALAFRLLGRTLLAMRLTSALLGLLAVLFSYLLARRLLGRGWALLAAAGMAVAFWPVSLSRQALRAITLIATWLPAAWLFWTGIGRVAGGVGRVAIPAAGRESRTRGSNSVGADPGARRPRQVPGTERWSLRRFLPFVLGGALLGLSIYTYMSSRVTWAVFPLWAGVLLLRKETRALLRRLWPGLVVFLLVAALVALPLVRYLRAHPDAERRFGDMMGPIRELLQGKPQRVLRHAWNALRVFSWEGDRFWVYNIPGRPVFGLLGSLLFYLGLAAALWRWADPRCSFLIVWLGVGMAPAMVTTNEGIFLRAIVAQPATYLLLALGVRTAGTGIAALGRRWSLPQPWPTALTVLLALAVLGVEVSGTAYAYFGDWPSRPEARTIYNHNLVALSRHARDNQLELAGVSALYPLYYHDPWLYRYVTGNDERAVRWFDGRGCIVYPGLDRQGRYAFSEEAPLHPTLMDAFARQATLDERVDLAPTDQNPYFELWDWQGGAALAADLERLRAESPMWVSPETQFNRPEQRQALDEPPRFGDVMALIGYRITTGERPGPGDVVELVTYWRALRAVETLPTGPAEDDWVTFVHLLDAQSVVIGGVDVLHCPPTGWLPGDVVVQVHSFQIADQVPSSEAYLEIGVYRRRSGRLPVSAGGQALGDRVLLESLHIE